MRCKSVVGSPRGELVELHGGDVANRDPVALGETLDLGPPLTGTARQPELVDLVRLSTKELSDRMKPKDRPRAR